MKKIYFILLVAVAMVIVFVLNNNEDKQDQAIYVATNGNDDNVGTKSKPFRTLKKRLQKQTQVLPSSYEKEIIMKNLS